MRVASPLFRRSRLILGALILAGALAWPRPASAALTEKNFTGDLAYYRKISKQKKMDANSRLYLLNRLREKYKQADFDLTDLYAEIDRWSGVRQKELAKGGRKSPAETPVAKKAPPGTARLLKALVTDNADASVLELKVPGLQDYKDSVIYDSKGLQPPVVVLFLYRTSDRLKPLSRNFRVRKGLIRQVRARSVSSNPPTVKVSASLRENKPVKVFLQGDRLTISVQKSEAGTSEENSEAAPGANAPTVLTPEQAGAFEKEPPELAQADTGYAAAPSSAAIDAATSLVSGTSSPAEPAVENNGGIIDVGDVLDIQVEPARTFSRQLAVRPDGNIILPMVGVFEASGLGIDPLRQDIESRLKEYVPDARVKIDFHPYDPRRVAVTGEVKAPGTYEPKGTCSEVLAQAGGLGADADRKAVALYRNIRGTAEKIPFDADAFEKTPQGVEDPALEPGDVVEVPALVHSVFVSGAVRTPGSYEFRPDMKVLQAVYQAGGFTDRAQIDKVRIIRDDQGKKVVQEVNLKELLNKHPELDLPLREGDIVLVPVRERVGKKWVNRSTVSWFGFLATLGAVLALLV